MEAAGVRLQRQLGYTFKNPELLQDALTHRSVGARNNERLEFLGDAVLGMVIADEIFSRYPSAKEGEMSRFRASMVKGEMLAVIARRYTLSDYVILGPGELKSGGFRRDSILANTLEAIIGAIYLDGGFHAARDFVVELFEDSLNQFVSMQQLKDPKTRLQELLQGRRIDLPLYEVLSVEGEAHNQRFLVECRLEPLARVTQGEGSSRRKAEQAAAQAMLADLEADKKL